MPLSVRDRVGPYEVVAPLGAGGMGEVYRALDTRLKREAALKCLPERLADSAMALERFRREAQLLAGLSHPHIAAVYGLDMDDAGGAVLAMEMVAGETLAERLRRGPMPPGEALAVALQIAEALEYAHERGIIHRDLKPANIKLTPDDQVKVLDFGLAKALAPELAPADIGDSPTVTTPATLIGTVLGTAAYMSPEQARGKAVDRRADIWAFGAVLYEMLTSQMAFQGDNATDVIAAVVRAEPDWERLPPATPPRLRELVQRTLRKDARQRLQSIGDARIALEEMASGTGGETTAPAAAPATASRRSWLGWAGPGLAGVVLAAVAAFFLLPRAAAPTPMRFQALTSLAGVQRDPALSPDGRSVAFASDRDGSYNIYVGLIGGGNLVEVTHGAVAKATPAWTPDGASLAYAQLNDSGLWDIWEVPALGGTARLLVRDGEYPNWSPDGQQLTYVQSSTGTLWIAVPGQAARPLAPKLFGIFDPRFSPDGREIAFAAGTFGRGPYSSLEVVNVNTGVLRQLTSSLSGMARSPAWTPDGSAIYFASSRGGTFNIWKIAAAGGTPQQITVGQGDDAELSISADGKRLAFATFRADTRIAELSLRPAPAVPPLRVLSADPARNQNFAVYSPDGKRLAYFSWLKGAEREQIWTSNADGSSAVPLVVNQNHNIFPFWSSDGSQVFFMAWPPTQRHEVALSEVPSAGGNPRVLLPAEPGFSPCAGPDGSLLYGGSHEVESLNTASGQTHALAPLPPELESFQGFTACKPDGGGIAYREAARYDGDPDEGLWVYDLHHPPRQVYRGWVPSRLAAGPRDTIYFLTGSLDLKFALWAVNWDGTGLKNLHTTIPAMYDYFWTMTIACPWPPTAARWPSTTTTRSRPTSAC